MERVAAVGQVELLAAVGALDRDLAALGRHHQARADRDVGKAGDVLAAADALEQEGILAVGLAELEEGRHRRVQVGEKLAVDGHQIALLGKTRELIVRWRIHNKAHLGRQRAVQSRSAGGAFARLSLSGEARRGGDRRLPQTCYNV